MNIPKTIGIIAVLTGMALMPLLAEKKPPQVSLKELTDPKSPSYVPYPYPKTEFEIIENFKYGVKLHFGPSEVRQRSLLQGIHIHFDIFLGLLEDSPDSRIGNILRVENLVVTSPDFYYYILTVIDRTGKIVGLGSIGETGLFGGTSWVGEKSSLFKTEKQIEEILCRVVGPIKIERIERVFVHSTLPISDHAPLVRIAFPKGVLYVDPLDNVYAVEKEEYWNRISMKPPDLRLRKPFILDGMNDRILYLKKIELN